MSVPEFSKHGEPEGIKPAQSELVDNDPANQEFFKSPEETLKAIQERLEDFSSLTLPGGLPSIKDLLQSDLNDLAVQKEHDIDHDTPSINLNLDVDVSDDGREIIIRYPTHSGEHKDVRTFHRNDPDNPDVITSFTVQDPRFIYKYEKVARSNDLWNQRDPVTGKILNEKPLRWHVELDKQWTYEFTDLDKQERKIFTADGKEIIRNLKNGHELEQQNTFITRVRDNGQEIKYAWAKDNRGHPGWIDGAHITEIKDEGRNWHWTKQSDQCWKIEPLHTDKAFQPPSERFKGNAEVNSFGDYILANEDHIRQRFGADGSVVTGLGSMADLRRRIQSSKLLQTEQKERLLGTKDNKGYLDQIAQRKFKIVIGEELTNMHPTDNKKKLPIPYINLVVFLIDREKILFRSKRAARF